MKKLLKRFSMLAIAFAMLTPTGLKAEEAALDGDAPSENDKATVTIYDVEEGLTVTAYQILKATYDESGNNFRGYVAKEPLVVEKDKNGDGIKDNEEDGNHIAYLQDPKSEEITKIATFINAEEVDDEEFTFTEGTDKFELAYDGGVYSADLAPGYYIVKVTGVTKDNEKIYNPMLVGVYYKANIDGEIKKVGYLMEYEKDGDEYVTIDQDAYDDLSDEEKLEYVHVESDDEGVYRHVIAIEHPADLDPEATGVLSSNAKWTLSGDDAYAKSSPIDVEKTVYQNIDEDVATNQDTNEGAATNDKHGDHHDIGDTVTFHAVADIPDYSAEYEKLVYKITDTLEKDKLAFRDAEGGTTPVVKVHFGTKDDIESFNGLDNITYEVEGVDGENEIDGEEKFTLTFNGENEFVLELNEAAIRAHGGEKIFLEYYAELLEGADQNWNENTNEIEVEFVNDPKPEDDGTPKTGKKKDITFHYTFELDGQLDSEDHEQGGSKTGTQSGHELAKVDENFDEDADRVITYTRQDGTQGTATLCLDEGENYGKYLDYETGEVAIDWDKPEFTEESWTKDVVKNGLEGAEFTLTPYLIKDDGTVPATDANKNTRALEKNEANLKTTTNAGGRLNFKGLDAGYYVMEETKAPKGYSKNPNKTVVFIDAQFYEEHEYYDMESDEVKALIDSKADTDEEMFFNVDYDIVETNDGKEYKLIKFHKGELKQYDVKRAQLTPDEFDAIKDDLSQAEWTETTTYVETRTIDNGVVDYGITTTVEGAAATFIQNTTLPVLPSTGGIGTYMFTIAGVAILAIASFMLLKKKNA